MAWRRPADVPDLAVPELDEVLDREARTGVLVEPDPVHAAAVFGGDGDDRHAELDAVERVERLALRRDEHDRLDVLPHEQFGRGAQARRVALEHARGDDRVPRIARRLVEVQRGARRAVVGRAGDDEPEGARAPGDERARRGRRHVAQLLDRLLDPGASRRVARWAGR